MAYVIPLEQPLSETQAKLIAQVGSMKNLADLPFLRKFKLKKEDNISLFDYLMKVLRAMGIDPQILITAFLNDQFQTNKMVDFLLLATAKVAAAMYKKLDPDYELSFPLYDCPGTDCEFNKKMTDEEILELIQCNFRWLKSKNYIVEPLTDIMAVSRTRILQELMIIIFGRPKKDEAAVGTNGLVNDLNRLNELIEESICGGNQIFDVSVPPSNDYGEIEYNRLQKIEQFNNGNLSFQITCEGVQISLPDDPMYLFKDVPPGFQGGVFVPPQAAMQNIFNFVNTQIQKKTTGISSESNAMTAEKNFSQKLLETLISSITCLVSPYFIGFIGTLPEEFVPLSIQAKDLLQKGLLNVSFGETLVTTDPFTGKRVGEYVPATSCEITSSYDKENLTEEQKKKTTLMTILCNLLLNFAISYILSFIIKQLKKLIKDALVKRAQNKQDRKTEKIKKRFQESTAGQLIGKSERAVRQTKLMQKILKLLKPQTNHSVPFI
jgi:hypothetical protein